MNIIRQTIGQLFGTAREKDTMQQVSAVAVANAAEVDTTDESQAKPVEAPPTESQPEPVEGQTTQSQPEPVEGPVATALTTPTGGQGAAQSVETMVQISATELLRLQAGANAYEAIKAEHAQLKQWHANAQGGIGLGPDANTATQTTARKVSAATARAIKIAEESGMYNN